MTQRTDKTKVERFIKIIVEKDTVTVAVFINQSK
jgi:hypothetical protein